MTTDKISTIELVDINEKLKKTEEDSTPYASIQDQKISVLGDANKTEVKKADYSIRFRIPQHALAEKPAAAKIIGEYYIIDMTYEDISLNPRNDLKIMAAIAEMLPFFNDLKENGEIDSLSGEEMVKRLAYAGDQVIEGIYNLVAAFLNVGEELKFFMTGASVIGALATMIDTHPEVFNEADVFFG